MTRTHQIAKYKTGVPLIAVAILLAIMAEAFVLITVLVLMIQPGNEFIRSALPIVVGVLITVVIGEIFINIPKKIQVHFKQPI